MKSSIITLMATLKKFIIYLLGLFWALILPIAPLLFIMVGTIFADTGFGIWSANKRKKKITSRAASALVSKILLYCGSVITFFVIDYYMLNEITKLFVPIELLLTKFTALVFCSIEILSIRENIKLATGVDYFEKAKELVKRGKSFKDEIEDFAEDKKDDTTV